MSSRNLVIQACLVIAPLMMVGGWGNSIFEPKLLVVLITAFALSSLLLGNVLSGRACQMPMFAKGLLCFVALQAIGVSFSPNLGTGLTTLGLTISWLIVFTFVVQSDFELERLCPVAIVLVSMCLISTLPDILLGISVLSPYAPRGGMIGVKNALSVFLAQLMPLLLLDLHIGREQALRKRLGTLITLALLMLSLYVVILSRTRSAWLMVLVYAVGLGTLYYRRSSKDIRLLARDGAIALVGAVLLASLVPTTLHWTDSSTPYLKSLSSLFSLEGSSGRNLLWKVSLSMIEVAPWLGNGTGSYASQWPAYISQSGVLPGAFAFLRLDLPLFNDYLQTVVENGIIAGAVFTALFLGFPAMLLWRQVASPKKFNLCAYALTLMCVATSVDALVDYPFRRVETSLFFITALGLVLREVLPSLSRRATFRYCLLYALSGCFVLALAITMGFAYWLRTRTVIAGDVSGLVRSISLWPFDTYFSSDTVKALLKADQQEGAARVVAERRSFWPSDPEGFLMVGVLLEEQKDFVGAEAAYSRARYFVEQGRCYGPGVGAYREFRSKFPTVGQPYDASEDQVICQRGRTEQ